MPGPGMCVRARALTIHLSCSHAMQLNRTNDGTSPRVIVTLGPRAYSHTHTAPPREKEENMFLLVDTARNAECVNRNS